MKKYSELKPEEQANARQHYVVRLLNMLSEGFVSWLPDEDQAKVQEAVQKADKMQTPWFQSEHVYEALQSTLEETALANAEAALYALPNDPDVVRGIAK